MSSVEVLECESFFKQTGTRTLFHIDCLSGKDIKNHSLMQQEDEILLLPARKLVVESVLNSGNGLHVIRLKETEPKFALLEPVSLPTAKPIVPIQPLIATNLSALFRS